MDAYQELINHLEYVGVRVRIERNQTVAREGFPTGSRHYDVIVSNQSGDSLKIMYSQGPAIKGEPGIFDVFSSLILDYDCGGLSFEDFCSDLGYNVDSREDYKLWQDARALNLDMYEVLGDDIVRRIQGIV